MQSRWRRVHPNFCAGEAFLHNDPYQGNSHAADTQVIVPVFVDGEHLFTAITKAHMVDCGNSLPTTYMPMARDVYEEGAVIFPCVRVQKNYEEVRDIIRMAERRIRGFDVWYGDYLAGLGAVRLAERRLKEFCGSFGVDTVKQFIVEWLDYSERMAAAKIATLPAGRITGKTCLDPFPGAPDGIPLKVTIDVDPEVGKVTVDLRDNPDCVPNGLNLTQSTAYNAGMVGVLNVLNSKANPDQLIVPSNAGTFRRIEVLLRENCVVGIPRHPVSTSVATTTVSDRVIGMVMMAFADLGEGLGLGEPCYGSGPYMAVISGQDPRRKGYFIFQLFAGTAGGPAGPEGDGWLMELVAGAGGLLYTDSSELVEQKNPLVILAKIRVDRLRWLGGKPWCTWQRQHLWSAPGRNGSPLLLRWCSPSAARRARRRIFSRTRGTYGPRRRNLGTATRSHCRCRASADRIDRFVERRRRRLWQSIRTRSGPGT